MAGIKKKALIWLLLVLLLTALLPVTAYADMGPKPSVQVTFENMDDRLCYGTLLSERESTGPANVWDGNEEHISLWGDQDRDVWQAFVDYQDPDGFYFLQWFWRCDETKELDWGYYPPNTFKILLYYPDTGEFLSSEILQTYAFDSYFTMDVTGDLSARQTLPAQKNYDYTREISGFMARLILTILIELAVTWLFGFRRKGQLLLVLAVNAVTQIALNVFLTLIGMKQGPSMFIFAYVVAEPAIVIIEYVAYRNLFHRFGGEKVAGKTILLYTLLANAISFGAGFLLNLFIPNIF